MDCKEYKEYIIYASFLEDLNDRNIIQHYKALDKEYCSDPLKKKEKNESEALEAFSNSPACHTFASKHPHCHFFVLPEGETIYHRAGLMNSAATNADE